MVGTPSRNCRSFNFFLAMTLSFQVYTYTHSSCVLQLLTLCLSPLWVVLICSSQEVEAAHSSPLPLLHSHPPHRLSLPQRWVCSHRHQRVHPPAPLWLSPAGGQRSAPSPLTSATISLPPSPDSAAPEVSRCSRLLSLATVSQQSAWDLVAMLTRVDGMPGFLQILLAHYQTDYQSNSASLGEHLKRHYFTTCALIHRHL